jgi:hypothetical protein
MEGCVSKVGRAAVLLELGDLSKDRAPLDLEFWA